MHDEPRHANGHVNEHGQAVETSRAKPEPKDPGRLRRLGQTVLYKLDPVWDKDEAITAGIVTGVMLTLAGGYWLYQDAHAPDDIDYRINPNYYVHMTAKPQGESLEHMVQRFGKRSNRPWVEHHAAELADEILTIYHDPVATLDGQPAYIDSPDEILTGGTEVQMTRYLLKRYPFGKDTAPGLPTQSASP
jgi:hypothetical protein